MLLWQGITSLEKKILDFFTLAFNPKHPLKISRAYLRSMIDFSSALQKSIRLFTKHMWVILSSLHFLWCLKHHDLIKKIRKVFHGCYKKVRRQGIPLPKIFRAAKEPNQFTIQTNRILKRGNVNFNPLDNHIMKSYSFHDLNGKALSNRVIGFHDIHFHYTIFPIFHPFMVIMKDFLAKKDVVSN